MFSGKKSEWECRQWSFDYMLHPIPLCNEIGSCTIALQFSSFSLPRKFLQAFSDAFQALLSVELNFLLKS